MQKCKSKSHVYLHTFALKIDTEFIPAELESVSVSVLQDQKIHHLILYLHYGNSPNTTCRGAPIQNDYKINLEGVSSLHLYLHLPHN